MTASILLTSTSAGSVCSALDASRVDVVGSRIADGHIVAVETVRQDLHECEERHHFVGRVLHVLAGLVLETDDVVGFGFISGRVHHLVLGSEGGGSDQRVFGDYLVSELDHVAEDGLLFGVFVSTADVVFVVKDAEVACDSAHQRDALRQVVLAGLRPLLELHEISGLELVQNRLGQSVVAPAHLLQVVSQEHV